MYQFSAQLGRWCCGLAALLLATGGLLGAQADDPPDTLAIITMGEAAAWQRQFEQALLRALDAQGIAYSQAAPPAENVSSITIEYGRGSVDLTLHNAQHDPVGILGVVQVLRAHWQLRANAAAAAPALTASITSYLAGDCAALDNALRRLTTVTSTPQTVQTWKGYCALRQADYDRALTLLAPLTQPSDYAVLAWLYARQGRAKEALAYSDLFMASAAEAPPVIRAAAYRSRAQVYATLADFTAAVHDLDQAITLIEPLAQVEQQPMLAQLLTERGMVYLLRYEWANARADFEAALHVDHTYAEAYFQRGILRYTLIERQAALDDFTTYLHLHPAGRHAAAAARYRASLQVEIEASGD